MPLPSSLFLEFCGTEAAIERDVTGAAREISSPRGAKRFEFEEDEEGRRSCGRSATRPPSP
jgi:hypothetical protein